VVNTVITLGAGISKPQTVTIWLNGASAPGWVGQWSIIADGQVIPIGLKGTNAAAVFPPTTGNEQWNATMDMGAVPGNGTPSANAITSPPFTVYAPPAPGATWASNCYINKLIVNKSAGTWMWDKMFATLPFENPDFKGARWTIQNGHYTNPTDPNTFVGGTHTWVDADGKTCYGAQNEGLEVSFTDDVGPIAVRVSGTDTVIVALQSPWTIPDYILPDGTINQDNVFRFKLKLCSPLSASGAPDDVTWTDQSSWSSGVGDSAPGQYAYQDVVFDLATDGVITGGNISPLTLGEWLGLDDQNRLNLATSVASLMQQIATAGYTIPDSLLADQKVLAYDAGQQAVKYLSGAAAANALVDSNIASVQIGKLISGTTVFSDPIYLAGGGNGPVVYLGFDGIVLFQ
jgi:hypothetical protein